MITGEPGTGKELVAQALHAASRRSGGPFIKVNMGALPDSLVERELFGHVRGAFTDAGEDRPGRFAAAAGGTILLDEIATLAPHIRSSCCACCRSASTSRSVAAAGQSGRARHRGDQRRPREPEMAAGRFRADLYHRLNVVEIALPPLRERGDDVLLLADRFLGRATGDTSARYAASPMQRERADWSTPGRAMCASSGRHRARGHPGQARLHRRSGSEPLALDRIDRGGAPRNARRGRTRHRRARAARAQLERDPRGTSARPDAPGALPPHGEIPTYVEGNAQPMPAPGYQVARRLLVEEEELARALGEVHQARRQVRVVAEHHRLRDSLPAMVSYSRYSYSDE